MSPKAVFFDLDNTLTHRALSIARYAEIFYLAFRNQLKEKMQIILMRLSLVRITAVTFLKTRHFPQSARQ